MYLNVCVRNKFLSCQKWQKLNFGLFRPNLPQLGLFLLYFVCKCSFREILMIKIFFLDQNKQIWLILKNKKSKFVHCTFIIHKNRNKTSIQSILKSNSTSFMFYNIFSEMKVKKLSTGGGGAWGNVVTILISSWKCDYSIYLDIQVYYMDIQAISTLLCLLLVLDV